MILNRITSLSPGNRLILDLSIIFLFAILIVVPIYLYGIPGGPDMYQHLQFAQTFYESFKSGEFFPSWAANPNNGYGDVSVRFYPPLTYYLFVLFRSLAGNWFDGTCLLIVFLFFIGSVGVYFWSREWFSENASLAGALIYAIIPHHTNQIYQASFIAEFTAASILPFCFLFVNRICRRGKFADCCGLSLAFSLLLLTHLPTTIMSAFILVIYSLLSLKRDSLIQSLLKLSASVSVSLLLSSFYWVRMITELNFVQHNSEAYSTNYFSYKSHFIFLDFIEKVGDLSFLPIDLRILLTLVVLTPCLIIYFIKLKNKTAPRLNNVLVITFLSLFMATSLSSIFWEYIPLFQKIQFPWRWLIFFCFGSAVIVSSVFDDILAFLRTPKRPLAILAIGLFCILPIYFLGASIQHPFYYPKDYFNTVIERFKSGPSNDCWWTTWAANLKDKPFDINPRKLPAQLSDRVVLNDRAFEIQKWEATERDFTIKAGEGGQAAVATMYYPYWKVQVNEKSVEMTPNEGGMMSFPVPAEESKVKIYFQEPPRVIISYYVSGAAWILFIAILFFQMIKRVKNPTNI
ncbi:MAG: glycosyltransferase family 39 protein [Pyrinomonadaceae bacterium]|nr:glycosyltransferase family 39 protein [Pyrinomonadaceae bacterium]